MNNSSALLRDVEVEEPKIVVPRPPRRYGADPARTRDIILGASPPHPSVGYEQLWESGRGWRCSDEEIAALEAELIDELNRSFEPPPDTDPIPVPVPVRHTIGPLGVAFISSAIVTLPFTAAAIFAAWRNGDTVASDNAMAGYALLALFISGAIACVRPSGDHDLPSRGRSNLGGEGDVSVGVASGFVPRRGGRLLYWLTAAFQRRESIASHFPIVDVEAIALRNRLLGAAICAVAVLLWSALP